MTIMLAGLVLALQFITFLFTVRLFNLAQDIYKLVSASNLLLIDSDIVRRGLIGLGLLSASLIVMVLRRATAYLLLSSLSVGGLIPPLDMIAFPAITTGLQFCGTHMIYNALSDCFVLNTTRYDENGD